MRTPWVDSAIETFPDQTLRYQHILSFPSFINGHKTMVTIVIHPNDNFFSHTFKIHVLLSLLLFYNFSSHNFFRTSTLDQCGGKQQYSLQAVRSHYKWNRANQQRLSRNELPTKANGSCILVEDGLLLPIWSI